MAWRKEGSDKTFLLSTTEKRLYKVRIDYFSNNPLPGLRKRQEAAHDTRVGRESLPAHLPLCTTLSWLQCRCINQV